MNLEAINVLLMVVGPIVVVGTVGLAARKLVHGHAEGYEKDVRKVKGHRPRPLPHQEAMSR